MLCCVLLYCFGCCGWGLGVCLMMVRVLGCFVLCLFFTWCFVFYVAVCCAVLFFYAG